MATAAVRISALRKEYPGRGGHQPVVAVGGIDVEIAAGERSSGSSARTVACCAT